MKHSIIFFLVYLNIFNAYSQGSPVGSVIEIDNKRGYQYDESIFKAYYRENRNVKSISDIEKIRRVLDSVGLMLSLTRTDEIVVMKNIAQVTKDNLIGFVDFFGHLVIKPKFQRAFDVKGTNYWIVNEADKWGLINPVSNKLIQFDLKYSSLNTLESAFYGFGNPNRYIGSINGLYGIVDSLENVVIPFEYLELDPQKDMYRAKKANYWGFIDSLNNIIIPFIFDECGHFYDNDLAPAKKVRWGLINRKGNFVIQPKYDDMFTFQKGVLRVKQNNKVGFLNEKGEIFIPIIYDDADAYYRDEVLRVKLGNKYAILDKRGKQLCSFKYDAMGKFRYNCTLVKINNSMGVIDNKGKEVILAKYEKIDIEENVIVVYEAGTKQYYNHKGEQIKTER